MRQRNKRHHHHQIASKQSDLFRSPDSGGGRRQPAWEALPPQTRAALTDLMTRLMLDHKEERRDLGTRETRHES
jgi:acyl-CoA reductase-like NAD-dependent aldehyde dehydrogenase